MNFWKFQNSSRTRTFSMSKSLKRKLIIRTASSRGFCVKLIASHSPRNTRGVKSPSPSGVPTITWACPLILAWRNLSSKPKLIFTVERKSNLSVRLKSGTPWTSTALELAALAIFPVTRSFTRPWKLNWLVCIKRKPAWSSHRVTWPMTRLCSPWLSPYLVCLPNKYHVK